jgi:hypothetical protein
MGIFSTMVEILALASFWALFAGRSVNTVNTNSNSLQENVVAKERQELDSLKTGKLDVFADLIADDALFVDGRGTAGKADVVRHAAEFKLVEYSIEGVKFVPLSSNSGVIAYKLTEKGNSHGKDFAAQVYASAVWTQRKGKWVCLFSQETAAR